MRLDVYIMSAGTTEFPARMPDFIHPIPAFKDNYIWTLVDDSSRSACVVDPGDADPVQDWLEAEGLSLASILITHHHPDHTGGLLRLKDRFGPVVYGPHSGKIDGIDERLGEGDEVEILGQRYQVIEVPGHTLDHIAFYCAAAEPPLLFCGDTLFAAGCGRLFEGTPAMMHASLGKLRSLPAETRVYCTHEYTLANLRFAHAADPGNGAVESRLESESRKRERNEPTLPSSIDRELSTNPFLRCDDRDLQASVEAHAGQSLENEVAVFAALRRWKDNF